MTHAEAMAILEESAANAVLYAAANNLKLANSASRWPEIRAALQAAHEERLDLEGTIAAIADPTDYETGSEKTVELCRQLAASCMERLNL